MDGTLMYNLQGNLNLLSEKSFQLLLKYFKTGTLSSQEQSLLLSEITSVKGMWKELPFRDSKTSTQPHETI